MNFYFSDYYIRHKNKPTEAFPLPAFLKKLFISGTFFSAVPESFRGADAFSPR